ncbi:MAG: dUTP diphosphatase [Treponema sp.]|jgi:dUTP pyrophosphatase|nr:dUTP diphosphatase [Treponema sp.]
MTGVPAVRVFRKRPGAVLPRYASEGAAGADIAACLEQPGGELVIAPGGRAKIPTGLVLEIPPGWEAQVRPRSGLAFSGGVTVLNAPGTIDSDYRGELEVLLVNLGTESRRIQSGDRIAQLVFAPAPRAVFVETAETGATGRGGGGFGSTGL